MDELLVPQALLEYVVGHPESSFQENRVHALAVYLSDLILVQSHPVEPGFRAAVETKWAEITVRYMARPSFCQDLQAAIRSLKTGRIKHTRKRCLADAFLLMRTYRDWWLEAPIQEFIRSTGIPLTFENDPAGLDFSDRIAFTRLAPSGLDFLRRLKLEYANRIDTYTVRIFARYLWHKNNHPDLEAPELLLNDEPSRTQWSRWYDELGLDENILPRSTGGRGK